MRALFVNENIVGGHAALHTYLRRALDERTDVTPTFLDVPAPRLLRRVAAASVPGLARADLDLQPLRYQLAQSVNVRRRLGGLLPAADVVHAYTHNTVLLSAGALATVPTVVGLDGTNEQNGITLPYRLPTRFTPLTIGLTRRFEERVYAAATLLIAQSRWAAVSLEDDYGIDPEKIRVVPYGMTLEPMRQREETVVPEVTFVGTSMARKGGWRVHEIWRRHLAPDAALNLVTHEAVPPAQGLHLHSDVHPGDGRVQEILARTAVFAFPSDMDKSSWAVLEAMHAGTPVVATRAGGVAELVEDGVTGILVEPDDGEGFSRALSDLLGDEERRAAMGAAGRRRVEEHFDARDTTATVVSVLEEAKERFGAHVS